MTDATRVQRFQLDVGWPWLLSGVLMLLAAGVIPSQLLLQEEQAAVEQLRANHERMTLITESYERFLDELATGDESVVHRLAGAQLGLISKGSEPLLMTSTIDEPPTNWIERAVVPETSVAMDHGTADRSSLARLLADSGRLWIFGAALLSIFIGLLFSTGTNRKSHGPSAGASGPLADEAYPARQ